MNFFRQRVHRRVRAMFCCCAEPPAAEVVGEVKLRDPGHEETFHEGGFVKTERASQPEDLEPSQETSTFEVKVNGAHGIQIDGSDPECTIVRKVNEDGMVAKWNTSAPENKIVKEGDRVLEVNGTQGSSIEMAKILRQEGPFTLLLQKPQEKVVALRRPGELGVVLNYQKAGANAQGSISPWIAKINGGLLGSWNIQNPEEAVSVHDRIRAVNGISGTPEEIMAAIRDSKDLVKMRVHHYGFL